MNKVAGLILAGGESKRFGSEKALAMLEGQTLLTHVTQRLRAQVSALAIAGRPYDTGLPALRDIPFEGCGPLAGLRAGLVWARKQSGTEWLLTAPCDVPRLPTNLAELLLQGAAMDRPVAVRSAGHLQVACAIWPVTAVHQIEAMLGGEGKKSLYRAFDQLKGVEIKVPGGALDGTFANINTPDDLEALASGKV